MRLAAALLIGLTLGLSGCGEKSQGYSYKNGRYAGKPDTPAWKHDKFNNDRAEWERAIKARNFKQSEYTRMKGSG